MAQLKLRMNEDKTRVHRVPEESFDFLGYTFGRCYSPQTGRSYIGTRPSKTRITRLCRAISQDTGRTRLLWDATAMVHALNRKLVGWSNYFCLGPVSSAYRAVDQHTRYRAASVVAPETSRTMPPGRECSTPANISMRRWDWSAWRAERATFRGRKRSPCPRAGCGKTRTSGSMSGMWKRTMAGLVRHRQTERGGHR